MIGRHTARRLSALPRYRFAGLVVSSQLPLPELKAASGEEQPSFQVVLHDSPVYPDIGHASWHHDWLDPTSGEIALSAARLGDHHALQFPGSAEASVSPQGRILLWRHPDASIESMRHVLLDQLLPRLIAQRGEMVLHGSLVVTPERRTHVVLGDSGMGKSTLAAAFAHSRGSALADDCVVLDLHDAAAVRAIPSYPGLRLWSDSVSELFGNTMESSPVAHYSDKHRLTLPASCHGAHEPWIDSILVLQAPSGFNEVRIEPLAPREACMALMRNSFQLDLGDHSNIGKLLRVASRACSRIPIMSLTYPRKFEALASVMERIRQLPVAHASRQA